MADRNARRRVAAVVCGAALFGFGVVFGACGGIGSHVRATASSGGAGQGTATSIGGSGATMPTASTVTSGAGSTGGATAGVGTAGPGTTVSVSIPTGSTAPPPTTTSTAPSTTTSAPPPPAAGTGAFGYVTAGPTCPVEQAGHPCPPQPVSGAQVDAEDAGGSTVASAPTDSAGRYAMALAPGKYTLVVQTASAWPRCPQTSVVVGTSGSTRTDITCDTGIR